MQFVTIARLLFKFRKFTALFVLFEWAYKIHKSKTVNKLRNHKNTTKHKTP